MYLLDKQEFKLRLFVLILMVFLSACSRPSADQGIWSGVIESAEQCNGVTILQSSTMQRANGRYYYAYIDYKIPPQPPLLGMSQLNRTEQTKNLMNRFKEGCQSRLRFVRDGVIWQLSGLTEKQRYEILTDGGTVTWSGNLAYREVNGKKVIADSY